MFFNLPASLLLVSSISGFPNLMLFPFLELTVSCRMTFDFFNLKQILKLDIQDLGSQTFALHYLHSHSFTLVPHFLFYEAFCIVSSIFLSLADQLVSRVVFICFFLLYAFCCFFLTVIGTFESFSFLNLSRKLFSVFDIMIFDMS